MKVNYDKGYEDVYSAEEHRATKIMCASILEQEIPRPRLGVMSDTDLRPDAYYLNKVYESGTKLESMNLGKVMKQDLGDQEKSLNEHVNEFFGKRALYESMGNLHKRGILIYGPPGSGKTTLIKKQAQKLIEQNKMVFFGRSPYLIKESLQNFRENSQRDIVVIMEDIDEVVRSWGEQDILSMFDGIGSVNHTLFITSANDPQRLSDKLKRPGRIDRKVYVPNPNLESRHAFLQGKLEDRVSKKSLLVAAKLTEGFSYGHLSEIVLSVQGYGESIKNAIELMQEDIKMNAYIASRQQVPQYVADDEPEC